MARKLSRSHVRSRTKSDCGNIGFMRRIIFYSWQSDLPNATNRGFILSALEKAAAGIALDDTVTVEPVIDRDTQGVPGSPDIAATIFGKIAASDIFVADVSIVTGAESSRATPNPNVLIELGYAMRALGPERIILVFNQAYGSLPELPFDLRMRRVTTYTVPEESARSTERKKLQGLLEVSIRSALSAIPEDIPVDASSSALTAIENARPSRRMDLRRFLSEILTSILSLEPTKHRDGGTAEELTQAINDTLPIVAEYSKACETAAVVNDQESAVEIYRWLGFVFDNYSNAPSFSGRYSRADHDFFKFIGHEMLITLVAFMMREQRWSSLKDLLSEPIPMKNLDGRPGSVTWEYASDHLALLLEESRKQQRMSLHGDLLNERHSSGGGLSAILPIEELMAADFFLFLLSRTLEDKGHDMRYWRAWSCLNLRYPPGFVHDSSSSRFAQQVADALGVNVEEYKNLLRTRGSELKKLFSNGFWRYPISSDDVERIATQ